MEGFWQSIRSNFGFLRLTRDTPEIQATEWEDIPLRGAERFARWRKRAWAGLPPDGRKCGYLNLSGANIKKSRTAEGHYRDVLKSIDKQSKGDSVSDWWLGTTPATPAEKSEVEKSIEKDILRTGELTVCERDNEEAVKLRRLQLRRVLLAYSLHNTRVGYCQAMNQLAWTLLKATDSEEVAFWSLAVLCEDLFPGYMVENMRGLRVDLAVLDRLVALRLPRVHQDFAAVGFTLQAVSSQWLLSLFQSTFPEAAALRVLDVVLLEGALGLFAIALGFLQWLEPTIHAAIVVDALEQVPESGNLSSVKLDQGASFANILEVLTNQEKLFSYRRQGSNGRGLWKGYDGGDYSSDDDREQEKREGEEGESGQTGAQFWAEFDGMMQLAWQERQGLTWQQLMRLRRTEGDNLEPSSTDDREQVHWQVHSQRGTQQESAHQYTGEYGLASEGSSSRRSMEEQQGATVFNPEKLGLSQEKCDEVHALFMSIASESLCSADQPPPGLEVHLAPSRATTRPCLRTVLQFREVVMLAMPVWQVDTEECRLLFDAFDKNADGVVDIDEFDQGLSFLASASSKMERLQLLCRMYDQVVVRMDGSKQALRSSASY